MEFGFLFLLTLSQEWLKALQKLVQIELNFTQNRMPMSILVNKNVAVKPYMKVQGLRMKLA